MRAWLAALSAVLVPSCGDVVEKPGEVTCTAGAFIECTGSSARFCNDTGDGFTDAACGAAACNATAQRCNECVPSTLACDGATLQPCDGNGLRLAGESCQSTCVDEAAGAPAHCAFLEPKYLEDVCKTPATLPIFAVDTSSATIDTNLDALCTGGIVAQTQGPALCVMRHTAFRITAGRTLTVGGSRALAVVTDGPLDVSGTLDISANGHTSGPGGGTIASGEWGTPLTNGVGGAGFVQKAGNGGASGVDGGGGTGGASFSPLSIAPLRGGPVAINAGGGGGGGAATLISCRGIVSVSGMIDAGGGGGAGRPVGTFTVGGDGGGAGGYVVLQGLNVSVTGRVFANGGGGGGGGILNTAPGTIGGDGTRSATITASGGSAGSTAAGGGGTGGYKFGAPGAGKGAPGSGTSGGGGGSIGAFQVYVPAGATPTLTPAEASPDISPVLRTGTL